MTDNPSKDELWLDGDETAVCDCAPCGMEYPSHYSDFSIHPNGNANDASYTLLTLRPVLVHRTQFGLVSSHLTRRT